MYFDILIGLFIPYNCFVLQPNGHGAPVNPMWLSVYFDQFGATTESNSRLCLILSTNPCISFLSQRPWEVQVCVFKGNFVNLNFCFSSRPQSCNHVHQPRLYIQSYTQIYHLCTRLCDIAHWSFWSLYLMWPTFISQDGEKKAFHRVDYSLVKCVM